MVHAILTIGHSTRPIEEFVGLLRAHGTRTLADVRTVPKSRHNPQYGGEALAATLAAEGMRYVHLPALGGLRRPRPDSPNGAWRNESFRGYADYMATDAFQGGLRDLLALAEEGPVAVMCAEAVPWRCHRSLIGDALVARGMEVTDIIGPGSERPHTLTPFARVDGERITYPAE